MKLIEVTDKKTKKLFNKLPPLLYKNFPDYTCPLISMVEETFDPQKNSFYNHGKAIRWVLTDEKGKPIGRIAAFIDFEKATTFDQPTGNIGFFECINDQKAADLLFNSAKDWLSGEGMGAMDGPANMGENYMNHGLLAWGYQPQGFGMPYNPPYYVTLFENFGFKVYYEQYTYHIDYTKPMPERLWKIAEWVARKPQFSFKHFDWSQSEQFIDDFGKVYEGAWHKHEHYKPVDRDELKNFLVSSKMILIPEFIWFAYHENEPIGLLVMLPDFNQALRYLKNGRLTLWNTLKLLWFIKKEKYSRTRILIMGIVERFQKSGIESAILWHMDKNGNAP